MRSDINRRRILLLTGAAFTTSLAGCSGAEDGEDEDDADLDEAEAEADEEEETEESEEEEEEEEEETAEYVDEAEDIVELSFGEDAETSWGVVSVVHGLEFADILDEDDDFPEEPDDGNQFVLVDFEARNEGDESEFLPSDRDVSLLHDGNQYDSEVPFADEINEYDSGEVQPDVTREGQILYEVPEDLSEDDLTVVWSDDGFDYEFTVHWTPQ